MGSQLLRPLDTGEVLDGAFTVYRRHFTAFFGCTFLLLLPALLVGLFSPLAGQFVQIFALLAAQGACIWLASEAILGRPARIGPAAGVGLRRMLPMLLWLIPYTIALGIGFILLIVPGVLLWIAWFAFQPIVVLERKGPFGRSMILAKDSFGKIFVALVMAMIIVFLPQGALWIGTITLAGLDQLNEPSGIYLLVQTGLSALTMPFTMTIYTLLYYDQRVRKEGFDVAYTAASLEAGASPAG